jgi:hypothetical protein
MPESPIHRYVDKLHSTFNLYFQNVCFGSDELWDETMRGNVDRHVNERDLARLPKPTPPASTSSVFPAQPASDATPTRLVSNLRVEDVSPSLVYKVTVIASL